MSGGRLYIVLDIAIVDSTEILISSVRHCFRKVRFKSFRSFSVFIFRAFHKFYKRFDLTQDIPQHGRRVSVWAAYEHAAHVHDIRRVRTPQDFCKFWVKEFSPKFSRNFIGIAGNVK